MARGEPLPRLIAGPYEAPRCQLGEELAGDIVHGITDGPIQWPYTKSRNGTRRLILAGDLVLAVEAESVAAVMAWWGVGRTTVQRWRRKLGISQFNPGTLAIFIAREDAREGSV